jgi:hypothetical protein
MEQLFTIPAGDMQIPCRLSVPDCGQIRRVVLGVHGLGGSAIDDIQVGIAEEMEMFYAATVRFDFPGHGENTCEELSLVRCRETLMAVARHARERFPEVEDLCIFATGFGAYVTLISLEELLELPGKLKLVVQTPCVRMHETILAMKKIIERIPDTTLLIAGNGPERENLEALVKEQGLENHVRFLGYTTELQKYLQVRDCEIACSYREGLPLNVMEAILCGKPVIASNNRGHRELIQDGVNGYIVEPDDVSGFAEKTKRTISQTNMNGYGIHQSVALFMDKNVARELNELYDFQAYNTDVKRGILT